VDRYRRTSHRRGWLREQPGCAADNAIAAALDYFAAATAPTPGLGAHTIAATLLVGQTEVIAGPGYDRCGAYAAEATAAGLQTVRDHLAAEAPADAT